MICYVWGVGKRKLRQEGRTPGLLTDCAISDPARGYCHIDNATRADWMRFWWRTMRHAVGEIRRLRKLAKRRARVASRGWETDSGQGVLI